MRAADAENSQTQNPWNICHKTADIGVGIKALQQLIVDKRQVCYYNHEDSGEMICRDDRGGPGGGETVPGIGFEVLLVSMVMNRLTDEMI